MSGLTRAGSAESVTRETKLSGASRFGNRIYTVDLIGWFDWILTYAHLKNPARGHKVETHLETREKHY